MSLVLDSQVSVPIASGFFNNGWTNGGFLYVLNASQYVLSFAVQNANVPFSVFPGQQWVIPIVPGDSNIRMSSTLFTSTTLANILYYKVFTDYSDVKDIPSGASLGFLANIIGGAVVGANTLTFTGPVQDVITITNNANTSGIPNMRVKSDGTFVVEGNSNGILKPFFQTLVAAAGGGPAVIIIGENVVPTTGNTPIVELFGSTIQLEADSGQIQFIGQFQITNIPFMQSGKQASGKYNVAATAAAANQEFGYGLTFPAQCLTPPSSISFSSAGSGNSHGLAAADIDFHGFTTNLFSTAAGFFFNVGFYTTVGNCLLAFDKDNKTYHHHCDRCDQKTFDNAYDDLDIRLRYDDNGMPHHSITHACPNCSGKFRESFNTQLTESDISSPLHRLTKDFCEHVLESRS